MLVVSVSFAYGQQIESYTDYFSKSRFTDNSNDFHNKEHGHGDLVRYGIKYSQLLSIKLNKHNQPTIWNVSAGLSMVRNNNSGEISTIVPRDIINLGAMVSYLHPISPRWSMAFSLGCGIYSQPNKISFNSILANGGCIVIYEINPSLSIGLGVGITNSFGVPMVMPTGYLKWVLKRRFELDVDLTGQMKITASTIFGERFRFSWNIVEFDAMSAVVRHDNKDKICSTMMLNSYFSQTFSVTDKFSIFANIGVNLLRFSSLSERKLKYMFGNENLSEKRQFSPSLQLGVGLRYGF